MRKPALTVADTELTRGSVLEVRLACLNPGPKELTRFEKPSSVQSQNYIEIKNWERGSDILA